jgi:hypothetical protein
MNNQTSDDMPKIDTPPRPLYQLAHLIAMLERQEQTKKASHHQEEKRQ